MEDGSYLSSLTPITNIGASADGAEMITFFAPPFRCAAAWGANTGLSADSLLNQGSALNPLPLYALHLKRQVQAKGAQAKVKLATCSHAAKNSNALTGQEDFFTCINANTAVLHIITAPCRLHTKAAVVVRFKVPWHRRYGCTPSPWS